MRYPNLREEKKLWKRGYNYIVGLDEAGRGPIAGPVVAAAVMIIPEAKILNSGRPIEFRGLRDSKKLSESKRIKFYNLITCSRLIKWGIGKVSEKIIDKTNILEATKLAMKKALNNLRSKLYSKTANPFFDYLIIDGNFKLDLLIPQRSIVMGDEKIFSCAAASVLAKVYRDKIMLGYHKDYPVYRFDRHKGYPTKLHFRMLKKYGPCKIHRQSFMPIRSFHKEFLR